MSIELDSWFDVGGKVEKSQNDPEVLRLNQIINKNKKSGRQAVWERELLSVKSLAYLNRNAQKNNSLEVKKGATTIVID